MRTEALEIWLSFKDLQKSGTVPNWETLRNWQDKLHFPLGRMLGRNSRRWAKSEIEAWINHRPVARKVTPKPPGRKRAAALKGDVPTKAA